MDKVELINKQISQISDLKNQKSFSPEFKAWKRKTASLLEIVFGESSRQLKDFEDIHYHLSFMTDSTPDWEFEKRYQDGLDEASAILKSFMEELVEFRVTDNDKTKDENVYLSVTNVLDKFHPVARQLRSRHGKRHTLDVQDEYDVQDLLHTLLKVKINDIRREEWTPSYGGGAARMDILLKESGIVIEVKMTRDKLRDRELGEQLIIDIAKYQKHPDCKKLICFVYDPGGLVGNPSGLQSDLSKDNDDFGVEVIIRP